MELHEKQVQILEFLLANQEEDLTLRDIQEQIDGLTSPSHVQHHLNQLEKKGYLKRNPSNPRDYKILEHPEKPISYINLYGMAQCGPNGDLLAGNPIDRIPVYSKLIKFDIREAFLVEAIGESMLPTIHEHDLVIAKVNDSPLDGDIIVCTHNETVMIKKYRKIGQTIILESINQIFDPVIVSEQDEFIVNGVMKGNICSHMDTINE